MWIKPKQVWNLVVGTIFIRLSLVSIFSTRMSPSSMASLTKWSFISIWLGLAWGLGSLLNKWYSYCQRKHKLALDQLQTIKQILQPNSFFHNLCQSYIHYFCIWKNNFRLYNRTSIAQSSCYCRHTPNDRPSFVRTTSKIWIDIPNKQTIIIHNPLKL